MKHPVRFATYGFAWLLLLLGSCTKNEDPPSPSTPTASIVSSQWVQQATTQHLQRLFLERQYDQQLIQPLADKERTKIYWTPLWHKAFQQTTPKSGVYVYIPLEAKLQVAPYSVHLMGTKRFLLVKQAEGQSEFSLATYLFTEPKQSASVSSVDRGFFASFSGVLMLKHLATRTGTRFTYQRGVAATQHVTPSSNSSSTTATPTATNSANAVTCEYFETCYWSASCRDYNGNYVVSGTMTSGQNYCPEPGQEPCSEYWGATWSQTSSERYEQCYGQEDPPPPPTDPTDGGSGSDGNDTFTFYPTNETVEPDLPSDCASWQFRSVGPSGYMACGVTGIEIDLISQYRRADGVEGISFNIYTANLFFEMPPRYAPGEAAMLCAQIKDEVEEFLEEKYRYDYPPDIAQTINSTFIREMTSRVTRLGGRVTQTAQYPNTPVSTYQHTFLPNNGGCF